MAITIPATGSGTATPVVATESIVAEHYQLVKLVNAAAASTTRTGVAGDPIRVDPTGTTTQPVSGTVTANAGTGTLTVDPTDRAARLVGQVEGRAAHNAILAGNPERVGVRGEATQLTAVTAGVTTDLVANRHGELRVAGGPPAATIVSSIHIPLDNIQATATRAAGAAGVRNVCIAVIITIATEAAPAAAFRGAINLIDGISGGTTYLWRSHISIPASAGAMNSIAVSNLWIPGTAATAMTLEFNAAGGISVFESVTLITTQITE